MIDMTSRPHKRYNINRRHYCDPDRYPEGKPIDPTTDRHAKKTEKGDWMCSFCIGEENKKMLSLFGEQKK
jgi:hypothetical protein